jgi:ketol-acid reductoisomerase
VSATSDACSWADVVALLIPDTSQAPVYEKELRPRLQKGKMLLFAHGFNIRYGTISPAANIDVVLIAPKAPGRLVRELFLQGGGAPALIALQQDATGNAHTIAMSYAKALGFTRAGVIQTSFAEETETDLFGEQAVLCGGLTALIKAGFETLVEAGYQPEIAYFECFHELKLIVDLMYRGGLAFMRSCISDTAEHGDYSAGPRIINNQTREVLRQILIEIQDGTYAAKWVHETETGRRWFDSARKKEKQHAIEKVGADLRRMMLFLEPVESHTRAHTI